MERTTGFEPTTLTLAKKGEENRPAGPSSPLTSCPVRLYSSAWSVQSAHSVYRSTIARRRRSGPSPRRRLTTVDTHCTMFG